MNETQTRIDAKIAKYKCTLMNDTKWREVLDAIGKFDMLVQFSFIQDEKFKELTKFPEGGAEGNHSIDCIAHGPFLLKEIYAIRCPRFEEKRDSKTGKKYQDDTKYTLFIDYLAQLGQLPLTEEEYGVVIRGYQK